MLLIIPITNNKTMIIKLELFLLAFKMILHSSIAITSTPLQVIPSLITDKMFSSTLETFSTDLSESCFDLNNIQYHGIHI